MNTKRHRFHPLWCIFFSQALLPILAIAIDTITLTRPLIKGQTLVSASEVFELGFFNPANSNNSYVGIWYKNIPQKTIVWVANRNRPATTSTGLLKIGQDGKLAILDAGGNSLWSSNQSTSTNTVAQLLDSGNFVVRLPDNENPDNYLWQSFDYPTDTLLPGMKLGWDSKTGLNRNLTSWKNAEDPSPGDYTFKLDINGLPEAFLTKKQEILYRSGPWNGIRFSGVPEMKPTEIITFLFEMNQDEKYYSFLLHNQTLFSRLLVHYSGALQRFTWIPTSQIWNLFWYAPKDQCDSYRECGLYGICDTNDSPVCFCIKGFEPKNPQAWLLRDGSDGCTRVHKLDCPSDGFLILKNMKLPETSSSFVDTNMNLNDCEDMCRKNCSCMAYTSSNITGEGSGCVTWGSELLDMRQYAAAEGGQVVYVRVAAADADDEAGGGSIDASDKTKIIKVAVISVCTAIFLSVLSICILWKRRKTRSPVGNRSEHKGSNERSQDLLMNAPIIPSNREYSGESTTEEFELPSFDFSTISISTDCFSDANKLGQGGFGCVYKGMLPEGQEIAVKRLSKNSGQGIEEFKNEVRLIARLQHRNLVRLLGCCIDMEEKMLIYEYMEHKSLDSILFNKERSSLLNWQQRFNIICGIARGLLYLHQDSRFRIIHRDLKASNILLDKDMTPKISDFGMARIFGGDETEANTKRVVGTYGYMAPEYAMDGLFSVKSDVFSFGVLVLEIVSGKKNRGFYFQNYQHNLLGHAWRQWREGKGLELVDSAVADSYSPSEVLRCVQVGLLCVQEQAEDRPNMATVVLMLSSESATLPQPKHPGFCLGRRPPDTDSSSSKLDESCTLNNVTVTVLDGR